MTIQFGQLLATRNGPINKPTPAGQPPVQMSLGEAVEIALETPVPGEEKETFKSKLKRAELSEKIVEAAKAMEPLALEAGDIEMIKGRLGQVFMGPTLVRTIALLLDPATHS